MGTISGSVYTWGGDPVTGAAVTSTIGGAALTVGGNFVMVNPAGVCNVAVNGVTKRWNVTVNAGQNTNVGTMQIFA